MTKKEREELQQARFREFFMGKDEGVSMIDAAIQMNKAIDDMVKGGFTRAEAIRFMAIMAGTQAGNNK